MSCYDSYRSSSSYRSSRSSSFDQSITFKEIKRKLDEARRRTCSYHEFDRMEDELYKQARAKIPYFGVDIGTLTYLAWEKDINDMHPFIARKSKPESYFHSSNSESYVLSLYTSRFEMQVREWWDERQYHVRIGRKSLIHDWSELKACMRKEFVPSHIKRNLQLLRAYIKDGKTFLESLNDNGFLIRELEFKINLKELQTKQIELKLKRDVESQKEEQRQEEKKREKEDKREREERERKEEKIREEKDKRERREEEKKREKEEKKEEESKKNELLLMLATPTLTINMEPKREGFSLFTSFPFIVHSSIIHFSFKSIAIQYSEQSFSKYGNSNLELMLPLCKQITQDKNPITWDYGIFHFSKPKFLKIFFKNTRLFFCLLIFVYIIFIILIFAIFCRYIFDPGGT
ncbi:uncharacterized protein HKW66_Vig0142390 [Vigna angularis]|uniref:Retrotransposon gag domain-containing protein n=1 Tax=Phaseolus angularis TaxID=3914 RepID=A0A8T0KHK9_PHAAN|nr:stress response protein NST1-like [Vigna angularis]KAG2397525.1 uncharacterized protein HKW66_Vig0142390 [Vigna angularis]